AVGRKPMLLAGALAVALASLPAFWLLTSGSLGGAMAAQVLLAAALSLYGGGSYTFFVELFPTSTRFTGAAISYNASYALFGGTGPFIGTFLVRETGNPGAPGYYLAAIDVCVSLIALSVPETARRDLSHHCGRRRLAPRGGMSPPHSPARPAPGPARMPGRRPRRIRSRRRRWRCPAQCRSKWPRRSAPPPAA